MISLALALVLLTAAPCPSKEDVRIGRRTSGAFREAAAKLPEELRAEAYRITRKGRNFRIEALTEEGAFRARQTLKRTALLDSTVTSLFDWPRFSYRGLMIDESRSFKGKEFLKKQMEAMALLGLNVLHLHLTDAAGWRIEIPDYPLLTEKAAWRIGRTYAEWERGGYKFASASDPETYGGYYTAEDLREIVAYAAERFITVIPEIEMPGHSMEVNRCYPNIACVDADGRHREFSWDLCPGNEGTFALLKAVLDTVMDIFPSRYIHIGGDEAVMKDWPLCVNCRARMEAEGFTEVSRLQGYMVRRVEKYLREHGRAVIGWDEILETGIPENAVVMSWRGVAGGRKASAAGHKVIMVPNTHCYFDYYQDLIRKEPLAVGPLTSLRRVYSFDPCDGLSEEQSRCILGLQANLWCEKIPTVEHAEYMLYPRLFAIAETGWNSGAKDWPAFRAKARRMLDVFRTLGYNTFDMDTESERALSRCWESSRQGYNFVLQEGGPTLSYGWESGVRIIVKDEWGFRDMNGNGTLDPFEDWRLSPAERAEDLRSRPDGEPLYDVKIPDADTLESFIASGMMDNPYRHL